MVAARDDEDWRLVAGRLHRAAGPHGRRHAAVQPGVELVVDVQHALLPRVRVAALGLLVGLCRRQRARELAARGGREVACALPRPVRGRDQARLERRRLALGGAAETACQSGLLGVNVSACLEGSPKSLGEMEGS